MANLLKQIFEDNWIEFIDMYGYRIRKVVIDEVEKMLNCGLLSNGYVEYKCFKCGESKKVAFRCKSRFCTTCGRKYVDQRAENMTKKLIRGRHRHMVFTVPEQLRKYFIKDRKLLEILPRCAANVLKSWFKDMNKRENFTPGIITVIHTFGRDLKWNPHVHVLVTEGASGNKTKWKKTPFIPYKRLRKSWQKLLLDEIEERVLKRPFKILKKKLYAKYPKGFYVYGKGEVKNKRSATQYVGRYTGRPAIANSRILKYDGKKVTFCYVSHEDGKRIEEEIDAIEFIKKVIIHIPEKQFKMVRYYGIYSSHTKKRPYLIKMVSEKILELKKQYHTWRYRIMKSFGHDPLKCSNCKKTMKLVDIYYPKYGSVLEYMQNKEYERIGRKIEEVEEVHNTVNNLTNGEIKPVFT